MTYVHRSPEPSLAPAPLTDPLISAPGGGAATPQSNFTSYKVQAGDNLSSILGTSDPRVIGAVIRFNEGMRNSDLAIGQELLVPDRAVLGQFEDGDLQWGQAALDRDNSRLASLANVRAAKLASFLAGTVEPNGGYCGDPSVPLARRDMAASAGSAPSSSAYYARDLPLGEPGLGMGEGMLRQAMFGQQLALDRAGSTVLSPTFLDKVGAYTEAAAWSLNGLAASAIYTIERPAVWGLQALGWASEKVGSQTLDQLAALPPDVMDLGLKSAGLAGEFGLTVAAVGRDAALARAAAIAEQAGPTMNRAAQWLEANQLGAVGDIAALRAELAARLGTQVRYGSTDLSIAAQAFREQYGISPGRNISVFEYVDANGVPQFAQAASERGVGHAERIVASQLGDLGIESSSVTRIYSELQPCNIPGGYCSAFISRNFPQAAVTWSFEYGATPGSRAAGVAALRSANGR